MSVPFVYLIGWSEYDTYYYGVRYASGCNPDDLWKSYFTSSKYVKQFVQKFGDPDIIKIRKVFDNKNKARLWEEKVLRRIKAVSNTKFLNKSDNCGNFFNDGGYKLKPRSLDHCKKISANKKGKKIFTEEQKKLFSLRNSGQGNPNFGKTPSQETREKMKKAQKNRPIMVEGKIYNYLDEVKEVYNLKNKQAVFYRVNSKFYKWRDWYYVDEGPQNEFLHYRKRPDLSERNKRRSSK